MEKPRTFVLSAAKSNLHARTNRERHCELALDLSLAGISFREALGAFEGRLESVFVVTGADNEYAVRTLARRYDQDSYLCVAENDREAFLVDCASGYHRSLGKLVCVDAPVPATSWTFVDGEYYTTTGRPGVDLPGGI